MKKQQTVLVALGSSLAIAAGLYAVTQQVAVKHEEELAKLTPAARGLRLIDDLGCSDCHQPDSAFRAPLLTGLAGKTVMLTTGQQVTADAAYLRRALLEPRAEVVQGYQPVMPSYKNRLSEAEIEALLAAMQAPDAQR